MKREAKKRLGRNIGAAALAWVTSLWFSVGTAMAQQQDNLPKLTASKPAIEWTIGSVFLVGCLVIAFKNSKRSQLH